MWMESHPALMSVTHIAKKKFDTLAGQKQRIWVPGIPGTNIMR